MDYSYISGVSSMFYMLCGHMAVLMWYLDKKDTDDGKVIITIMGTCIGTCNCFAVVYFITVGLDLFIAISLTLVVLSVFCVRDFVRDE